jgi:hypothetical protein
MPTFEPFSRHNSDIHAVSATMGMRGFWDFEGALQGATKRDVNAVVTASTVLLLNYPKRIAEVAIKHRLPFHHPKQIGYMALSIMTPTPQGHTCSTKSA